MWAHADDLRAEVEKDASICNGQDPRAWVEAIATDWRRAELAARELEMLSYAMKLTADPGGMCEADIEALRAAGLDDTGIHDLAQVVGLFNYYNRLADGLGIELEEGLAVRSC